MKPRVRTCPGSTCCVPSRSVGSCSFWWLPAHWRWLSNTGWMGVDLFFVLSGFLIGSQVCGELPKRGRLNLRAFYLRRAWRILPAFWVVLAALVFVPALQEEAGMEPWWKFALFVFNLSVDYASNRSFSHAWSLCVEEHFYLLFPLLAWGLWQRPGRMRWLAGVLVLGGIVLRSALWLHDHAVDPGLARNWFVEDIYYPTWCRLDGLIAGVTLAFVQVRNPEPWLRFKRHSNAAFVLGLCLLSLAFWMHAERTSLLANSVGWPVLSGAMALLVFAAADMRSAIGRWRVPGAGWVAAMAYSLYLSHKIALHLAQPWVEAYLQGWPAFFAYALAVFALGAAIHYAVERPCLRLRARVLNARPKA